MEVEGACVRCSDVVAAVVGFVDELFSVVGGAVDNVVLLKIDVVIRVVLVVDVLIDVDRCLVVGDDVPDVGVDVVVDVITDVLVGVTLGVILL